VTAAPALTVLALVTAVLGLLPLAGTPGPALAGAEAVS
jgi:hypothetical protein